MRINSMATGNVKSFTLNNSSGIFEISLILRSSRFFTLKVPLGRTITDTFYRICVEPRFQRSLSQWRSQLATWIRFWIDLLI